MKMLGLVSVVLWAVMCSGQEVNVAHGKGGILILSISAKQSYSILASETKRPVLSVLCSPKGKKAGHLITFTAGGMLGESDAESGPKNGAITLHLVIGGEKLVTDWIPYGDTTTFAYYGKTEPERAQFLSVLLKSPTMSVEFTPFLTGNTATAIFDISQLRDEVNKHPECAQP